MGEGKPSVIVPITAASIADRQKLARVIVLPSLPAQMFHMLRRKLGGLLNRRIYNMPFSRSVEWNTPQAKLLQGLYQECQKNGGILVC